MKLDLGQNKHSQGLTCIIFKVIWNHSDPVPQVLGLKSSFLLTVCSWEYHFISLVLVPFIKDRELSLPYLLWRTSFSKMCFKKHRTQGKHYLKGILWSTEFEIFWILLEIQNGYQYFKETWVELQKSIFFFNLTMLHKCLWDRSYLIFFSPTT